MSCMKRFFFTLLLISVPVFSNYASEPLTFRQKVSVQQDVIRDAMIRAKNWQEAQHVDHVPTNWLTGTFYSGVFACYEATGEKMFLDAARDWCEAAEWKCGESRPLNADDICSAQTFLDVYSVDKDPDQISNIINLLDTYYIDNETIKKELLGHAIWNEETRPFNGRNLWWWCDALYMAPPVMARVAKHTGDDKYTDLMHGLFWDAVDYLYDEEENLFYRDKRAFDKETPNGKKFFWGRGNGWVVGGLVRTIDYLDNSDPYKEEYIELFQNMMLKITSLQGEDGLWGSSVNDREWLPEPESSASSFFTFGLAAGINRGWLDERTYLPYLVKAWEGLLTCLRDDGKLEWAQLVDDIPRKVRHEDQKNYAQGAFLLAASEMYKMNLTPEKYSKILGERRIVTIAEDGAWTWYNDERVVFWNNHLVSGHVNSEGQSAISLYLLPGKNHRLRLENIRLSSWEQKDDHNNPALLPLNEDSLLAVYARHNTHEDFHSRIVKKNFQLGSEESFDQGAKVTYSNLYQLSGENGKIYNFYRGRGWNPNVVFSMNNGETWSEPVLVFVSGDNATRPYVKYASNNTDRIDLLYTDGHPRREQENNVYHVYYQSGNFYRSNGELIRSMDEIKTKPLDPKNGTLIYDGSGPSGRGWVHDIERGKNGELAGVYISSPDGDEGLDLRYRYARYDPKKRKWQEQEIAFAGPHLYVPENHYAGGICIDPEDINIVYLSSKLDPLTSQPNGTGKFQIYKAVTENKGKTWEFEQLTYDLQNDNLRPVVPRDRPDNIGECVVWFRGDYIRYQDYNCEITGFITKKNSSDE